MRAGDLRPLSTPNRFAFVLDAREARREPGILPCLRAEGIMEAAQHRRMIRRRIEREVLKMEEEQGRGESRISRDAKVAAVAVVIAVGVVFVVFLFEILSR
jgi:hypothetical protein